MSLCSSKRSLFRLRSSSQRCLQPLINSRIRIAVSPHRDEDNWRQQNQRHERQDTHTPEIQLHTGTKRPVPGEAVNEGVEGAGGEEAVAGRAGGDELEGREGVVWVGGGEPGGGERAMVPGFLGGGGLLVVGVC